MSRNHSGTKITLSDHSIDRSWERLDSRKKQELTKTFSFAIKKGVKLADVKKIKKEIYPEINNLVTYMQGLTKGNTETKKTYYLGNVYVYKVAKASRSYTLITVYPCKENYIEILDELYEAKKEGGGK